MRAEAAVPLGRARFTELSLLVWVATFAITGFVAVLATESSSFKPTAVVVPVVFLALVLTLHVFLVSIRFRGDQVLMPLAAGLTAIGLVLVQRLASDLLLQQLSWSIIAAGAFAATIVVPRDLTALARFKWTWALLGILLLMAPLLPVIGREINGARIWIKVGPGSIEPWEAVKILLVIFFAAYLEEYREVLSSSQRRIGPFPVPPVPYLVPIVAMWLIAMLVMVFEKDMGATVLFFGIFLAMLFLATGEAFYAVIGLVLLAFVLPGSAGAWYRASTRSRTAGCSALASATACPIGYRSSGATSSSTRSPRRPASPGRSRSSRSTSCSSTAGC